MAGGFAQVQRYAKEISALLVVLGHTQHDHKVKYGGNHQSQDPDVVLPVHQVTAEQQKKRRYELRRASEESLLFPCG